MTAFHTKKTWDEKKRKLGTEKSSFPGLSRESGSI
jgi:hypothetical protein